MLQVSLSLCPSLQATWELIACSFLQRVEESRLCVHELKSACSNQYPLWGHGLQSFCSIQHGRGRLSPQTAIYQSVQNNPLCTYLCFYFHWRSAMCGLYYHHKFEQWSMTYWHICYAFGITPERNSSRNKTTSRPNKEVSLATSSWQSLHLMLPLVSIVIVCSSMENLLFIWTW